MCKEDGVGGKKEASLVHKMVQGSQVFHGGRLAATEACSYQKKPPKKNPPKKTEIDCYRSCPHRNERPKARFAHYFVYHKISSDARIAIAIACQPVSSYIVISLRANIIEPCDSEPSCAFAVWNMSIL